VAQGVPGGLRPRIFLTFRYYKGGRSSAKRTGRLYPRRNPWYSLSEAESTSGHMVLSGVPRKKFPVTPPGIDPRTVWLVAQRLNHYATPGTALLQLLKTISAVLLLVLFLLLWILGASIAQLVQWPAKTLTIRGYNPCGNKWLSPLQNFRTGSEKHSDFYLRGTGFLFLG